MLVLTAAAVLVAAIIQRVTGLAFVLVLIGPIVLVYGPVEGVTVAVFLAVIASLFALPGACARSTGGARCGCSVRG